MSISLKFAMLRKPLVTTTYLVTSRAFSNFDFKPRERIVIIGSGWGGYSLFKRIDHSKTLDVTMISDRNHFLFTPLLASTTVGTLEFRSVTEPVRTQSLRRPDNFHLASVTGFDFEKNLVKCQSAIDENMKYTVEYDKLIIAVGARPQTFNIPGVYEHAHFLKEVADARRIRVKLLENFELACETACSEAERRRLLHCVVVGGGPTGVEFAAELHDFIFSDVAKLFPHLQRLFRVSLVDAGEVLSGFKQQLRDYAETKIASRSEVTRIRDSVSRVTKDEVFLKTLHEKYDMKCGLVVWSTGVAPRQLVLDTPELGKESKSGRIVVDEGLRVKSLLPILNATTTTNGSGSGSGSEVKVGGKGNVYAIGDCAVEEKAPHPPTAQVANRQGKYLAGIFLSGKPASFSFVSQGMLAYVGDYQALADTKPTQLRGFLAWLLWRSAYLSQLGSWRLRMQVPIDWFKTFFMGRDISRF